MKPHRPATHTKIASTTKPDENTSQTIHPATTKRTTPKTGNTNNKPIEESPIYPPNKRNNTRKEHDIKTISTSNKPPVDNNSLPKAGDKAKPLKPVGLVIGTTKHAITLNKPDNVPLRELEATTVTDGHAGPT